MGERVLFSSFWKIAWQDPNWKRYYDKVFYDSASSEHIEIVYNPWQICRRIIAFFCFTSPNSHITITGEWHRILRCLKWQKIALDCTTLRFHLLLDDYSVVLPFVMKYSRNQNSISSRSIRPFSNVLEQTDLIKFKSQLFSLYSHDPCLAIAKNCMQSIYLNHNILRNLLKSSVNNSNKIQLLCRNWEV